MAQLSRCDICGTFYNGRVDGDCGANDAQHRAARGQRAEEIDDEDD